jgi:GNAT superfamily N-acetyltransferase
MCLAMSTVRRTFFINQASDLNVRLAILAVLPRYRFKGIEAALIMECIRRARARGIVTIELSLVAENNSMMNTIIKNLDGVRKSRSYAVYRKQI